MPNFIPAEVLAVKRHQVFRREDDVPLHIYAVIAVTEDGETVDTVLYIRDDENPLSVVGNIYHILPVS